MKAILLLLAIFGSLGKITETVSSGEYTYTVIQGMNNTWGYDIAYNKKVFIHQPVVPGVNGHTGFIRKEDADNSARYTLSVLRKKDNNLPTGEIDILINGRVEAVGFCIGTKGYVGLGRDSTGNLYKDFWEYNPDVNAWTRKADFGGTSRSGAVGFSIGMKGYVGTGKDENGFTRDFWEYDQGANAWTQKKDFDGTARSNATGFNINTKGYVGTGRDKDTLKRDFWEYDQTRDTWTSKADFGGRPRQYAAGFSIGNKGYLGTGDPATDTGWYARLVERVFPHVPAIEDFWEYDQNANNWTRKADFGGGFRGGALAFSIGAKGYLGAGIDGFVMAGDIWEYDPARNNWIKKTDMAEGSYQGVAFSIGTKGFTELGLNKIKFLKIGSSKVILEQKFSRNFWELDVNTTQWTRR